MLQHRACHVLGAVMALLLSSAASNAFANDLDYFSLSPDQLLNAHVVSASKKSELVSKSAAAVFVITQEDIQRSGVTNIPDALRMAPGVQVAQSDSNSWAISIRGFNSLLANKLLVLIDGRTVYNPLFSGTYWEAQDLVLEDIDRIEVIRGPGGALWGANAVNGVINIITKQAKDTQGNFLSGAYGNHERGLFEARHGGTFGDNGAYRVYAKQFTRDSFPAAEGGGNAYDDWESYRTGFRADWGDDFTLQGDLYRTRTNQLNNILSFTAPFSDLEEKTIMNNGANLLARWKKRLEDGGLLTVQSYVDYTLHDDNVGLQDERLIYDLETQYDLPKTDRHEITVGGGYRFTDGMENGSTTVSLDPEGQNDSLYNIFLQDKIALMPDRWYLTLGGKLEHNDYTGFELEPSARLAWYPDEDQTVWASVSRAVRTPNQLERNSTARLVTGPGPALVGLAPNPDLGSEDLTAYELGYRNQITSDLALDVTGFYNDYKNLEAVSILPVTVVNNGIDPPYFFVPFIVNNQMHGETYGFEVAARWSVTPDWSLSATYSRLEMALHNDPGGTGDSTTEGQSPAHQASLRSSWNINENWTFDTNVYYVGELPANNISDYVRVDLNVGWRIKDGLRFNLVGQNLTGAHQEFGSAGDFNAAKPNTSVFGKLTWQF